MRIILLEKIGNLGNLGDIVIIKSGYARNFLTPADEIKRTTGTNIEEFEARCAELEVKQTETLADTKARQERLEGQTITVAQKAGVGDRLLDSVINTDIAETVIAAGIQAAKASVHLPNGPLKAIGEYKVEVALHTDAVAKITIAVVTAAE